jgi:cell division cycle protein 20 (cofactor of APC complex)
LAPTSFVTPSKFATPQQQRPLSLIRRSPATVSGRRLRFEQPLAASTPPAASPSVSANTSEQDRFIPSRRHTHVALVRQTLLGSHKKRARRDDEDSSNNEEEPAQAAAQETPLQKEFKRRMLSALCNVPLQQLSEEATFHKLLAFGNSAPSGSNSNSATPSTSRRDNPFAHDVLRSIKLGRVTDDEPYDEDYGAVDRSVQQKVLRKVPSAPFRILDAPDIVDDYYLNLISWSKDNVLAVALAQSVYLWNAENGEINHLVTLEHSAQNDYVTSVCWCNIPGHTKYIAVGTNRHEVMLFDAPTLRKIRTFTGHVGRVSSLAWNQSWLSSGARDGMILNHDTRVAQSVVAKYTGHQQEICGMKWNEDGSCLASGGNENAVCLWDAAMSGASVSGQSHQRRQLSNMAPRLILRKHKAAVKALDWCPFYRGLLASGGGSSDRTIKFWNTSSGAMLNSVDTGSQVCSILWNKNQRELCSSHGYSENQLILWKYPTMTRIKELKGHTARVLNMELSPDGSSIVSAAADETLRFWNVFGHGSTLRNKTGGGTGNGLVDGMNFGQPTIR